MFLGYSYAAERESHWRTACGMRGIRSRTRRTWGLVVDVARRGSCGDQDCRPPRGSSAELNFTLHGTIIGSPCRTTQDPRNAASGKRIIYQSENLSQQRSSCHIQGFHPSLCPNRCRWPASFLPTRDRFEISWLRSLQTQTANYPRPFSR
jgi:hypothetical protein